MKKYLAFDTANEEIVVGGFNGKKYVEIKLHASGTENLLPLIDKVLKKLKMQIDQVEVLCIGVGPGSWTGSRVAVVTAFGLKAGNPEFKLSTFNSFDLISYNVKDDEKVLKLVKAYANFVYVQNVNSGEIMCITMDELCEKYEEYKLIGLTKVTSNTKIVKLNLQSICEKLVEEEKFVDVLDIEPMYLRLSQAEYQKMKKDGKGE